MSAKEALWEKQNKAIRHPSEVFGTSFENAGITRNSLKFKATASFAKLLNKLELTLVVSREYENLLIALSSTNSKKVNQSFFHAPHPSGIVADRKAGSLYVAATRNPNQILEFKISKNNLNRIKIAPPKTGILVPSRGKYYPGQYYFHDLAICNNKLYANSVGMNCVVQINFSSPDIDKPFWWPKCIEKNGKPDFKANYIQLNSIAFGKNFRDSYFSASASKISARRPGQLNFPVNKRGVIFSGNTREQIYDGLTRPHSARFYKNRLWVANSGYGEVGYYKGGEFKSAYKFKGWTRGLCFVDNVLFVGVSRVLPRFKHYAPGIKSKTQVCSIVAIDLISKKKIGEIKFPFGNQIFAIDYFKSNKCKGFPFNTLKKTKKDTDIFSVSV
jgi:uncharacterized protein (TIGR03032 family)